MNLPTTASASNMTGTGGEQILNSKTAATASSQSRIRWMLTRTVVETTGKTVEGMEAGVGTMEGTMEEATIIDHCTAMTCILDPAAVVFDKPTPTIDCRVVQTWGSKSMQGDRLWRGPMVPSTFTLSKAARADA